MAISSALDKTYDASQSARFRQRVAMALIDTVATVNGESSGANLANRKAFAAQVALAPDRWAAVMAFGILIVSSNAQAAITAAGAGADPSAGIADADIKAACATVWDFYSNAAAALVGTAGNKVL